MNRTFIIIALFWHFLATSYAFAEEPENGIDGYHELVDSWMNDEISSEALIEGIGVFEDTLMAEDDAWENLYWLSRIALIRGQIYYETADKKASLAELEMSHRLIEESIAMHEHSDSWRIMSEASSLIMIQRGLPYIILNFRKGQKQAAKSLELDPDNARSHLIVAQFLTHAPRIAGGNMKKGLKILQVQASRGDLIDEDKFLLLLTLSEALDKNKQTDRARSIYQESLEIYPDYRKGPTVVINLE
jgi:tetratricopeptide (TPR) repeat protein